jgi:endonuclease/exonuclease/phosphatase family metal-dependent hydrolase
MSRRVAIGVRMFTTRLFSMTVLAVVPSMAEAQNTVVLDAPQTEVVDTMVRGGDDASTNFEGQDLMTRSSDNMDYVRRALLKFNTERNVPSKATIKSATLTLTVKGGNAATRKLSAYRVSQSFDPLATTWKRRNGRSSWKAGGGDLGKKYAEAWVTPTVGSKVTFDVTKLVQEAVNGDFGSRWTRIAVIDNGPGARASYREYHSSEASNPAVRPSLRVVYERRPPSRPPAPRPAPPPPPPDENDEPPEEPPAPAAGSSSTLRVLHWNLYHGQNAKKRWGFPQQMEVIANAKPDIISLNEVEKFNSSYGNIDQAAELAKYLTQKTGTKWSHYMRVASGSSKGIGNAVLSRFPIDATSYCQLSRRRNAVHMSVVVNGRTVNVWSTHLAVESGRDRVEEAETLLACMDNFSEQRIVAGDFNAQSGSREVALMTAEHFDTWSKAKSRGDAINYSGNCDGCSRRSRIDYLFTAKSAASTLVLKSAQMIDTRDARGTMASDHKPMLVVYSIQ